MLEDSTRALFDHGLERAKEVYMEQYRTFLISAGAVLDEDGNIIGTTEKAT